MTDSNKFDDTDHLEDEIEDLKRDLEHFQKEKERVRTIIGQIGGVPKFRVKVLNFVFIFLLISSVALSVVINDEKWRLLMIEFASVILSVKIILLIHWQMKVNHFMFWVLSSIEWRLNEVKKQIDIIQQATTDDD